MTPKEANELGFDLRFLNDFCEGDEVQVQYFLNKFRAQFPLELDQLEAAIGAEDRQGVHRSAHTLRPQFDFVGLHQASALTAELQHSALEDVPFDRMKEMVDDLKVLLKKVKLNA